MPAPQDTPTIDLQQSDALLRYEQMVQLEMASFRRSDLSAKLMRGGANRWPTLPGEPMKTAAVNLSSWHRAAAH
jgi:hypothetical protein